MTLIELTEDTTIQGNVRISYWDDDEEYVIYQIENTECLRLPAKLRKYRQRDVKYIFCPGDNFIHIEIEHKSIVYSSFCG